MKTEVQDVTSYVLPIISQVTTQRIKALVKVTVEVESVIQAVTATVNIDVAIEPPQTSVSVPVFAEVSIIQNRSLTYHKENQTMIGVI